LTGSHPKVDRRHRQPALTLPFRLPACRAARAPAAPPQQHQPAATRT